MLTTTTYLLTVLRKAHRAALAPRLASLGLNVGDELLLAVLWREEGIPQGQLAAQLGVSAPSVSKVVRTLERTGFVERVADPGDGRVARVHLTERGSDVRPEVERAWRAAERETLGRLAAGRVAALHRLLAEATRGEPGAARGPA
jgi:DNA-binding MarR family transcriptional regulator